MERTQSPVPLTENYTASSEAGVAAPPRGSLPLQHDAAAFGLGRWERGEIRCENLLLHCGKRTGTRKGSHPFPRSYLLRES